MATNRLRKEIVQASESLVVKTSKPKPPQPVLTVGVPDKAGASSQILSVPKRTNKLVIPATWTEAIRDPQLWAELRPLLVDED